MTAATCRVDEGAQDTEESQVEHWTFTVREPSLVNRLISICHCLSAMVGRMIKVDALMDIYGDRSDECGWIRSLSAEREGKC